MDASDFRGHVCNGLTAAMVKPDRSSAIAESMALPPNLNDVAPAQVVATALDTLNWTDFVDGSPQQRARYLKQLKQGLVKERADQEKAQQERDERLDRAAGEPEWFQRTRQIRAN